MKQTVKRGFALLMTVVMCLSLIPTMAAPASAAKVDYVYGTGEYSACIYNWGTRGETATSLSPNAESFYTNTTYEYLSTLTGGTGTNDAPDSELYAALQTLMESNHQKITTYSETKSLFQFTDCQNGGGAISSFYSGASIGPAWDGTWNREHTWPNSKSNSGGDSETSREVDIIMLRPTASIENSSRGNTAYGESSDYYDPNSISNSSYNLHGDVARVILYVYTRWGDEDGALNFMWGSEGVIESLSVLLKWMEEDPVDTWEMGRNDSVESITGTRNVFVDYPELAFRLFGETVPANIISPSYAATHEGHTLSHTVTAPTCTEEGYTTYTCSCGVRYVRDKLAATGHSFSGGTCSVCGESEPATETWTLVTDVSALKAGGQIVIVAAEDTKALSTTQNDNNRATAEVTKGSNTVTFGNDTQIITLENGTASGTFAFKVDTGYLYAASSSKNYLRTQNSVNANASWLITIASSGVATVKAQGTSTRNWLRYNSSSVIFACYGSNNNQQDIAIYAPISGEPPHEHRYNAVVTSPTCTEGGYTTFTCECKDSYVADYTDALGHAEVTDPAAAPTCTATGLTEGKHCSVCNKVFVSQTEIPMLPHSFTVYAAKEGLIVASCDHGCGETDAKLGAPSWRMENGEIMGAEYTTGCVIIALYNGDDKLIAVKFCEKGEERVFDGKTVYHFMAPEFVKADLEKASKIKCFNCTDKYIPLRDVIKIRD